MEETIRHTGHIRQISVGADYKTAMKWVVGTHVYGGRLLIVDITEDQHDSIYLSIKRYNIFVEDMKTGKEFLWKSFENMPCIVEYFNPTDLNDETLP